MLNDLLDIESARILIVDDEEINLDLISAILKTQGFTNLVTFQNPRLALASYQAHKPDLVLMDFMMPELNGLELLRLFREEAHCPEPPVIVLTADDRRETKLAFLGSGAKDFLRKPYDVEEVVLRVKNWLLMHLSHKESLQHNNTLDVLVEKRTTDLLKTQKEILERLGLASEFKDVDTHSHTIRVGQYAGCIAKAMGFNDAVVEELLITAPLHDIGKIGVPDSVLLKPGKLDATEWTQMQMHTTHGYNILKGSNSALLKSAEIIALTHHERWDGQGYPQRLEKTEIHLYGRIAAVCDVYDALTMDRPYKKAWTHEAAINMIVEGRGTQFDPELSDVAQTVQSEFLAISKGRLVF